MTPFLNPRGLKFASLIAFSRNPAYKNYNYKNFRIKIQVLLLKKIVTLGCSLRRRLFCFTLDYVDPHHDLDRGQKQSR
jgi:hypothetical protein